MCGHGGYTRLLPLHVFQPTEAPASYSPLQGWGPAAPASLVTRVITVWGTVWWTA